MSGKWARTKGHSFERFIANRLKEIFPNARRHLEYQDAEANGVDISNTGLFKFQCKKLKAYASINTINEIDSMREIGEVPVLVTAGDSKPPMAVLYFDDLLGLLRSNLKASRKDFE